MEGVIIVRGTLLSMLVIKMFSLLFAVLNDTLFMFGCVFLLLVVM